MDVSDLKMILFALMIMGGYALINHVQSDDQPPVVIQHDKDFENYLQNENTQLKTDIADLKSANQILKHEVTEDSILIYTADPDQLDSLRAAAFK